jgi:hypothetical protein
MAATLADTRKLLPALPGMGHRAPILPGRPGLGLELDVLEELLTAVGDREDVATADARARLCRGRRALEAELARALEA